MSINFSKLHGLGNDYIVIDERDNVIIEEKQKSKFARQVCRRGFSVGADGVLFLDNFRNNGVQMRIFNADGSEAESCGNGLRCAAYFHHGIDKPGESSFQINLPLASPVKAMVELKSPPVARVTLEMGKTEKYLSKEKLTIEDKTLNFHSINVGNPHAVFFLSENEFLPAQLEEIDLDGLGEKIQAHSRFENTGGINAEFVTTNREGDARMRVHERGVGETTSCGTGSVAVARAIVKTGLADGWIEVDQPGGTLQIHPEEGKLAGPAEFSYSGSMPGNFEIKKNI
ncbi:MAG: diaminopimelate epimerase [bacterium]